VNRLELREWRKRRWLTQAGLGELLGVERMTIYRWESGDSTVPPFLKLALERLDTMHYWSPAGIDVPPSIGAHANSLRPLR
jgi:DNA-binding XRE family transcriptional regulator